MLALRLVLQMSPDQLINFIEDEKVGHLDGIADNPSYGKGLDIKHIDKNKGSMNPFIYTGVSFVAIRSDFVQINCN